MVDLQGNTGGNNWPMLAGIGPVLGEGVVGSFSEPAGRGAWIYRNGQALLGDMVSAQVAVPYHLRRPDPPVAVLTDGQTASATEMILVAFRGRPGMRSFGEATTGVPSSTTGVPLNDGARLVLTEVRDLDRTGRAYEDPIAPDVPVPASAFWRGTDKDAVLVAGAAWLKQQPACATP